MSYPDCAGCGEPVRYDAVRAYYEHQETGELAHVDCYDEWAENSGNSE